MSEKLNIKSFCVTVEAPIYDNIILNGMRDVSSLEKLFIQLRDSALNLTRKSDYDRARALLKWATTCYSNGVNSVTKRNAYGYNRNSIEFTFHFRNYNMMTEFVKGLEVNINF